MIDKLKKAWRAYSVQGIAALASMPWWWPAIEHAANGVFGPEAQKYAALLIGVAAVLGWTRPQPKVTER